MKKRELWLDNIRAVACLLVVTAHLTESLFRVDVLKGDGLFWWIFYVIHACAVQVFFFVGGYVYQKYKRDGGLLQHVRVAKNRVFNLCIPYVSLCIIIYVLKSLFASLVNSPIDEPLWVSLFLVPPNQMWFLPVFAICYVVTPTFSSRRQSMICLVLAGILKAIYATGVVQGVELVYWYFLDFWFFFILGMIVAQENWSVDGNISAVGVLALPLSVVGFLYCPDNAFVYLLVGLLFMFLMAAVSRWCIRENRFFALLAKDMMYVYLLHTMCAAPVRLVLLALGIRQAPIHLVMGLLASVLIPMELACVIRKIDWINFIFSPSAVLATRARKKEEKTHHAWD